jgi:hypothetical protein
MKYEDFRSRFHTVTLWAGAVVEVLVFVDKLLPRFAPSPE